MRISGTFEVTAPRELVSRAVQDVDILRAVIPGCTSIEAGAGPGAFDVTAEVGIEGMKGEHSAAITVRQTDERSLEVMLAGAGASRLEATAALTLSEGGSKTLVTYEATMSAQGAIARLGGKRIEGAAGLLVRQMLRALKTEIEARMG